MSIVKATKLQRRMTRTTKQQIPRNFDSSHVGGHIVMSDLAALDLVATMTDTIEIGRAHV